MPEKKFYFVLGALLISLMLAACSAPTPADPTEFIIGPCDNIILGGTNRKSVEFSVDTNSSVLFLRADFAPKDPRYREADFIFEAEEDWELTLERDGQYFSEFTLYTSASDVSDGDDFSKSYLTPRQLLTVSCAEDCHTITIPHIYNGDMVSRVDLKVFIESEGNWQNFIIFKGHT